MPFQRLHKGKGADKNHNPRKGTETIIFRHMCRKTKFDKNHNPRKGTETLQCNLDERDTKWKR